MGIPKQAKSDLLFEDLRIYHEQVVAQKQKEYQEALVRKAEALRGKRIGQCVVGVRYFTGVGKDKIQGLAKNTKTNSLTPEVGAVVVTRESWAGHVAVVLKVEGDKIYVFETNYIGGGRAGTRWLSTKNKKIKGYLII